MIFKTIDADATKLTKQMGLLGKSFNDIKKDYSNGLGLTKSLFSTSISESDWKSLQKFNSAIKVTNDGLTKSQRITKAWNENMTGCSITAKRMGNDLVTGKKKISDVSAAMKTATVSTKGLEIAMNLVANVGFMLAISAITKVVSELAQAQSKAVETAKEATSSYNDELSSIKDYKEKISELTDELNSGNLSYEETKTKRSELMSIQDELIKKFGTEKSAIESVTDAIGGQVNALDDLSEKAYRDWIAKADDETIWTKLLPWGKSGLDQAIDYMESKKTISFFDMANANSTTQDKYQAPITDEIRSIQEEIDKTIQSKYNLEKEFATFKITGTPEEIKSQLEAIRQDYLDLSKEAFLENGISSEYWDAYRSEAIESINDVINQFDKGLEKHQETYKTYIEGMIKYDSEYSDEYATILRKRAELEDAENSGDAEKIQTARQEFMNAIADGITASGSDENIKKFFESLYPELQSEFSNWNFEIAINANTDNLKTEAEEIGKQYSATDLLNMVNTDGIQDGEDAFNKLIDKAIEYGVCTDNSAEEVQKLIDLLVELGIVQGNIESDVQHETPILSISDWLSSKLPSDDKKTWSDAIDDYQTKISKLSELSTKLKEAVSMDDLESSDIIDLAQDFGITGDSIEKLRQKVESTMDLNYDSLIKSIDEVLKDQPEDSPAYKAFKNLEEQIKRTHDEAVKAARHSSQSLKGLSTMKGGIGSIVSAYNEKKESKYNTVSANTLNSMYDTLGIVEWDEASQKAWDNYINYAASGKSTLKELKAAQDELATAYVNSNSFLKDLNESNKEAYITMLKEMGIKNANEVVTQALTNKEENFRLEKILLINTSKDFQSATANDIEQLQTLGMVSETEAERIAILALQKQFCNNNVINTEADCENVYRLAKMAGASVDALSKLDALKARLGEKILSNTERENISNRINEIIGEVEDSAKTKINIPQVNVNPSIQSNDSSNSKSSKDSKKDTKEIFDWIERRINKLKKVFEKWNKQAEESMNPKRISAYYKFAGDELKKLLSTEQKAYSYYRNKADSVGLDESYASKVRNGSIEIDTIRNEKLIDKIQEYQKWYDKMVEMSDNFLEDVQKIYDIPSQKREQLVERFETRNGILEGKEENAIGYKKKNKILTREKKNARGVYNTYVNAQKETQTNLNSAKKDLASNGLTKSSGIAEAVKNEKEIDLSGLKENSSAYRSALKYNEALRANKTATDELATATSEYRSKLRELQAEKFNNITDYFSNVIGLMDNKMEDLDNKISDIESQGKIAGTRLYERQIVVQENIGKKLTEEEKILKERIKHTKKGTDEWYEQKEAIQQIQNEQAEVNAKIHEAKQAVNEVSDTIRENIIGLFHDLQDEMDLLNTLLGDNLTDNDTGDFTKEGRASLSLFKDQIEISKQASSSYLDDISRLQKVIENGNYSEFKDSNDQTYKFASKEEALDKIKEFYASYREEIKKSYDYENSVIDLVKQKYEAESEYLSKLIDKKKELLDTEKDIHQYSKDIKKKTEDIDSLKKQISALSGDDSVETGMRVQKLQKELKDSEKDLKETEYEKFISDQENMLDKLIKEHDTLVTNLEKDRDALLKEGNQIIEEYSTEAVQTINDVADKYDYQMTSQTSTVVNKMDELGNVLNEIRDVEKDRVATEVPADSTAFEKDTKQAVDSAVKSLVESQLSSVGSTVSATLLDKMKETAQKKTQSSLKKIVSSLPFSGATKKLFSKATKKLFGFSKGGVVNVNDAIKENGDEILVSAKNGERILTPVQNEMWEKWTDNLPNLMNLAESLQVKNFSPTIADIPNIQKRDGMGVSYGGGNTINVTLPDVRNYEDFMQKFQKDPNAEKLVNHMVGNAMSNNTSRLGKFNQKF